MPTPKPKSKAGCVRSTMWKFVPGVKRPDPPKQKPPPKKAKVDSEKQKNYDAERHFKLSWRFCSDGTERFWLILNNESGLVGCSVCSAYAQGKDKLTTFAQCTAECKKDTITKHEKTVMH